MLIRVILIVVAISLIGGVAIALFLQPRPVPRAAISATEEIRFEKIGAVLPAPTPLKNLFTKTEKQTVPVGSLELFRFYDYQKKYSFPAYGQAEDAVPPLDSDELGVLIRDDYVPRFYPIRTLYDVGVLNDTATHHSFVIVAFPGYVPRVYDRTLDGKTLLFASSGYRHAGDPLFTDTETNTLWGQKEGQAIMGEKTGASLSSLPYELTEWRTVAQEYPGVIWYMQARPFPAGAVTMK